VLFVPRQPEEGEVSRQIGAGVGLEGTADGLSNSFPDGLRASRPPADQPPLEGSEDAVVLPLERAVVLHDRPLGSVILPALAELVVDRTHEAVEQGQPRLAGYARAADEKNLALLLGGDEVTRDVRTVW